MLWRSLHLVGFALLLLPGTVEQLAISFLVALGYMLLFSIATPFKVEGDNYFGQACSATAVYFFCNATPLLTAAPHHYMQACNFALTAVFFFSLAIKFGVLTDTARCVHNPCLAHSLV